VTRYPLRPPKKKSPKSVRTRGYDQYAHAAFLKEVAEAAHETDPGPVFCVQDGVNLHWAPAAQDAIPEGGLSFTDGHPAYSPDLNCVENATEICAKR